MCVRVPPTQSLIERVAKLSLSAKHSSISASLIIVISVGRDTPSSFASAVVVSSAESDAADLDDLQSA